MSYYSKRYGSDDTSTNLILLGICIALMVLLVSCTNFCAAPTWNNGVCPDCETRYELRGISNGLKYYACPECGEEVVKY